jgi:hypothetical protein
MKTAFNGVEEEKTHLALQQFAANLAVYSLHLDKGGNANEGSNSTEGGNQEKIGDIAQKWPIGMLQWILPFPALKSVRKSVFVYHKEQEIERFD